MSEEALTTGIYAERWARAAALMAQHSIDALFVMKPANLAYLTGDGRPCALALLTASGETVVAVPECDVPAVGAVSAATEVRAFRSEEEMFHGFRDVLAERGLGRATIGLEKNFFDAALFEVFAAHILGEATPVSATPVLSRLRMLKDTDEIRCLLSAGAVADAGMAAALGALAPGVEETIVAAEAEYAMRSAGAVGWAAPVYVASGTRSAMAHGPASRKVVEDGDVVQVHVAPVVDGYTVDLCRTFFVGAAPAEARLAYRAYLAAQEAGIDAATAGQPLLGIDAAMSRVLAERGEGNRFLRPVFHGVGIEHEEAPIPGGHAVIHGEERIEAVETGMVLAIGNCGVYRAGWGVRAEDTVWVSPDGPTPLTRFPKMT